MAYIIILRTQWQKNNNPAIGISIKYSLIFLKLIEYELTFLYIKGIYIRSEEGTMTKITEEHRNLLEQSIYLPLVLSVLEYDRKVTEKSSFKIKLVYLNLIEFTMLKIQKDLKNVNDVMRKINMKAIRGHNDGLFTEYDFYYKGFHEKHRYFNANLRNKSETLLNYYLTKEIRN